MNQEMANSATLVELLRSRSLRQADRLAYAFQTETGEEMTLTYAQLDQRARALGALLQSKGLRGERALLLYQPGMDYIVAFFGCLYAGVVAVPAYPPRMNGNLDRLQAVVTDSKSRLALTTEAIAGSIQRRFADAPGLVELQWVSTDESVLALADSWQDPQIDGEHLAFLQYTSGSTSAPKGVMLSHSNLLHNLELIQNSFGTTADDRAVIWLPPYHDMGLIGGILQPLFTGYPVVLMAPVDFITKPLRWLEAISRTKATLSGGPNFAYDLCMQKITPEQREALDLSSWKTAFSGAEPVRAETLERFSEYFGPSGFQSEAFYPCYGLAEGTLFVSGGLQSAAPIVQKFDGTALEENRVVETDEAGDHVRTLVSSGNVMYGNQRVAVVNPQTLRLADESEVGEIWVCGPSVAQGYWQAPEKTAETFQARLSDTKEGPFLRTGDLGFLRGGELFVTGRLKDLIIIRGRNHYPQDIEFTVQESHPAVHNGNGAAFAVDVDGEERLVIVQELERSFRKGNHEEVMDAIRTAISEHHQLQVYAIVLIKPASIPKTSSGKIQRHACKQRFGQGTLDVIAQSLLADGAVEVAAGKTVEAGPSLDKATLLDFAPAERPAKLQSGLLAEAARVLKVSPSKLSSETSLNALGLDSLMAVELKNTVEENFGVELALSALLDGPTVAQLSELVLAQMEQGQAENETVESTVAIDKAMYGPGEAPLSHNQQALYFIQRLDPTNSAYNLARAVKVPDTLDKDALQQAFVLLVERHPSLRTVFAMRNDQPVQRVLEILQVDVACERVEGLTDAQWREKLADAAYLPFDLEQGPLLRAHLYEREQDKILLLTLHHIIVDFWSFGVLFHDLWTLYDAVKGGKVLPNPVHETYADFSFQQQSMLRGKKGEQLGVYWLNKLANASPVLSLPTDRPRPLVQSYRGDAHGFRLSAGLTEALKAFSKQQGVTLYMTLLAAFQVLLYRYTGQEDLLVGSPMAGRSTVKQSDVIGYFVNPVVLRGQLHADLTFRAFLEQVRGTVLGALDHQDYPFHLLVEKLQPQRDPSYSPLFQVMFTLQRTHLGEDTGLTALALGEAGHAMQAGGLTLQTAVLPTRSAQMDLALTMGEVNGMLGGAFEFNTDLFDKSTIARLTGHFETLLQALLQESERSVDDLPMVTDTEREQLLGAYRETQAEYPQDVLIYELFEQQVQQTPDAVALVFKGQTLTYGELNERSNRLAHFLQKQGVSADVLVGVSMERSLEMVVALYGVLKAGGAYVPIDPTLPEDRLAYMLEDSAVSVLLTQSYVAGKLPAHGAKTVCLDSEWELIAAESGENLPRTATPDSLAYMIYTSGSTGKPKGAMNFHRAIFNRLYWMQETFGLTAADRILQKTPFSFDVSVWEFFWPLMFGARLVIAQPEGHKDAAYLVQLIQEQGVTTLHFVPSMLQVFLEEPNVAQNSPLRQVMASGEALPYDLLERFFARFGQRVTLNNLYGPTEAAVDVTFWSCQPGGNRRIVPIGKAIANTEVLVLGPRLQLTPVGVPGELHIGGVQLAKGYHNRPDLTAEKFIAHPYREEAGARLYKTGDLVRLLPDGNIEYLGRTDFQVKIRGFRIELGEIEAVLEAHEQVRQAVVTAHDGGHGGKRLVAYVVSAAGVQIDPQELKQSLKSQLPDYMVPADFLVLEALPLSPNGKVDRKALPVPGPHATESEYVAPRDEREAAFAAIWAEVLNVGAEEVGIDDNYFERGGDSIRSIKVMSKARQIGLHVTLQQLLQYQTIRELAEVVRTVEGDAAEEVVQSAPFSMISEADRAKLPADAEDAYPLSKLQEGMLFHSQLNPDSSVYHNVISACMQAPFDEQALKETVQRVMARHHTLRTSVDLTSYSESMQIVHREVPTPLVIDDMRHLSDEEQEKALDRWFADDIKRHFDFSRAPLMRFQIHRRTEETFQFAFTEHHVISDGWSVASLLTEFFATYASLVKGEEPPMGEVPTVAYRDFIKLERAALASEEAKGYWESQLSGYTFTKLPRWSTGTPSAKRDPDFRTKDLVVSLLTSQKLHDLASLAKAPLKTVLLAAHFKVMSLVSGQSDIVTGVVANGRVEADGGERVIGLHLNSLPYRVELTGGTWLDLVKLAFDKDREALPHRRYPMAQVQKDLGGQPLFEALFNYINFHVYESLDAYSEVGMLNHREFIYTDLPFNAEFSLSEQGEVQLRLQWDGHEFSDAQIETMAGYYLQTFELMAQDPEMRHEKANLLSAAERERLLHGFNNTAKEYAGQDGCLQQFFEAQVASTPDAQAVVYEGRSLTYRELNERANQLAHYLQKQGVGPDVLVGISIERSLEMVIGLYAILKAGGAYVPIDPTYPQDRLAYMLEDSAVSVLLTTGHLVAQLPAHQAKTIALDDEWDMIAQESAENLPLTATPNHLAYMIYTSGSTGKPKGAMNEHRGIINRLLWMQEQFALTEADRILQKTPFSFDVSVWEFFWPLMVGATLVVARPEGHRDAAYLAELIQAQGITTLHFVPSMLQAFLEEQAVSACTSIRQVMCSGEALPYELQERFFTRFGEQVTLNNLYGPTEAAVDVTYWGCERSGERAIVPIGRAIANTQIHILDSHLQPVPIGSPGELHIGGVQVARGYHNRPDLTAEKFIADPFRGGDARLYKTGDLARYLPDGTIEYLGRIDFQVKIRGLRIELGEIENALLQHPHIEAAAVLVRQAVDGGQQLFACYTSDADSLEATAIKDFLSASLPDYMVPQTMVRLDEIPLSPNGKIDRNKLNALAKEYKIERIAVYEAPTSELQEKIASIWVDLLGVERVGIHDNFFDLGGHSLLVMKVYNALKNDLGLDIPMTDLFQYTTVQQLADAIATKNAKGAHPSPASSKRDLPASETGREREMDIAIIGMGLRFPDASTPDEFWHNLRQGKESIRRLTPDEVEPIFYNQVESNQASMVYAGSFLEGIDQFDPEFFGMSEREAILLDPQQRLFLECVWEAMEDACYDPDTIDRKVSLYAGATPNQYLPLTAWGTGMADMYQAFLGSTANFMATRVSYKLNLRGESMMIATACSTSLVAVHMACQSLREGKADYAIAGGATVTVPQKTGYLYEPNFIQSPDGHCRAFDKDAEGTVSGNGVGAVFLKRLSDAQRDGDPIYAVIKGSAINNDGNAKIGYTAPSIQGQMEVIEQAQAVAGVDPETITYIEAHGTGTKLGDPIEISALTQAFRQHTGKNQYCAIGSVKTNIGHLDSAAGIAGLIKAALTVYHGEIPPSLHYHEANPHIDFANSPFYVNATLSKWQPENGVRRAGVSAFGIGGTNAHVILEEVPKTPKKNALPGFFKR